MKLRMPASVQVLGRRVRIDYLESLPDEDGETIWGESDALARTISINLGAHDDDAAVFSTTFHELLHVALGLSGHGELLAPATEEALVMALEGLAPLFRWRAS